MPSTNNINSLETIAPTDPVLQKKDPGFSCNSIWQLALIFCIVSTLIGDAEASTAKMTNQLTEFANDSSTYENNLLKYDYDGSNPGGNTIDPDDQFKDGEVAIKDVDANNPKQLALSTDKYQRNQISMDACTGTMTSLANSAESSEKIEANSTSSISQQISGISSIYFTLSNCG